MSSSADTYPSSAASSPTGTSAPCSPGGSFDRRAFEYNGKGYSYHDLAALANRHDREPGPSIALPSEYIEAIAVVR